MKLKPSDPKGNKGAIVSEVCHDDLPRQIKVGLLFSEINGNSVDRSTSYDDIVDLLKVHFLTPHKHSDLLLILTPLYATFRAHLVHARSDLMIKYGAIMVTRQV